jgi:hypothetical protein
VFLKIALLPIDFLFLGGARDYRRSIVKSVVRIGRAISR